MPVGHRPAGTGAACPLGDDARFAHRLVVAALEFLGEPQQQRTAGEQLGVPVAHVGAQLAQVGRALAMVADDLRDQGDLAGPVAGKLGVQDQVVRVAVAAVVADRDPDVVQQRGGP